MSGSGFSRRAAMAGGLAGAGLLAFGRAQDVLAVPRSGGSIRVATQSSSTADTLDPAKASVSTDYVRIGMVYEGLTTPDAHLRPVPALAESLESRDRQTWIVKLRRGVTFHDGGDFTADDVVFSLLRHKDPATASKLAGIAADFASIRASGRHEVTIRLTAPNADLPAILSQPQFAIVRKGDIHPRGNGTGPFRVRHFQPGVRTVGERFADYWMPGRPYLDRIELIAIPDEVSRVNALLAGDCHMVNAVNPRSIRRIEASGSHRVMATPSGLYTDLIMRADGVPTGNPHFVEAIKHLIDRPLVKRALFRGHATIGNDQPIPPFHPYYNPNIPQTTLDLDRARWHIAKAGLKGVRVPVYCSPAAEGSVDMASIIQEFGAQAGLELAVNRVPADGYWSTHWMRHPMTFGNTNPRPTADLLFSQFYKSNGDWNETGWKNERFDRLLADARSQADETLRKEIYGEMQRIVHDKAGTAIPVFISLIDGYDKRIRGLQPIPLGAFMGYRFSQHVWLDA